MQKRKLLGLFLTLVLVVSFWAFAAEAATMVDTEKPASLTLTYRAGGESLADVPVQIYRVAEISEYMDFTLTGEFDHLSVEINQIRTQEEWNQVASTLSAYVAAEGIAPHYVLTTDPEGKVSFTEIPQGLYLVAAVRVEVEGGYYHFDSFMISLPDLDEQDQWVYEVEALPKSVYHETTPEDIVYTVNKLWKDEGHTHLRPQSIQLELYRDGQLVETVTLSAENNWSYSWTAPDDGAVWQVVEANVPEGYKVTMQQRAAYFFVTNSYNTPDDPPSTGDITNARLYLMIMCAAGAGLVLLGVTGMRRKKA